MEPPILTSLGMYIIDDNKFHPSLGKEAQLNILGGGAAYTIVGGRIISGAKRAKQLCSIIDKGSDYPLEIQPILDSWGTDIKYREDLSRLTNRGVNYYDENDIRHFYHTAPKKRISVEDIVEDTRFYKADSFHMCCAVQRCDYLIDKLIEAREGYDLSTPIFIFEPNPSDCTHANLKDLQELLAKVDIFSPNFDEACDFLNVSKSTDPLVVAADFAKYLRKPNSGVLIRCGPQGCCYHTIDGQKLMLPPYHVTQDAVRDVTGGGNSFCGGMVTAFVLTKGDWLTSSICGNLASGCVIERLGVPEIKDGKWNGHSLQDRWVNYRERNDKLLSGYDDKRIEMLWK